MVIDCHYHLETRIQSVENLILKMDLNGIDKTALMATMWDPPPDTGEIILKLLRFSLYKKPLRGLAKKLSATFSPEGDIVLPKQTVKLYHEPDNESVAKAMAAFPDRFLGWIFVNPRGKNNPLLEYENWKDSPGFIGVKAHPFWHRFAPIELLPLAEKLAESGKPLLLHLGFDAHGDFISLVERVPNLKLVLAHSAFPCYSDTWKQILDKKNILVDLSADTYVTEKIIKKVVASLGPDRCLFGSDGPYGHKDADGLFDNGLIKRRIEKIFPDQGVQKRILGDNFKELIKAKG